MFDFKFIRDRIVKMPKIFKMKKAPLDKDMDKQIRDFTLDNLARSFNRFKELTSTEKWRKYRPHIKFCKSKVKDIFSEEIENKPQDFSAFSVTDSLTSDNILHEAVTSAAEESEHKHPIFENMSESEQRLMELFKENTTDWYKSFMSSIPSQEPEEFTESFITENWGITNSSATKEGIKIISSNGFEEFVIPPTTMETLPDLPSTSEGFPEYTTVTDINDLADENATLRVILITMFGCVFLVFLGMFIFFRYLKKKNVSLELPAPAQPE